MTPKYGKYVFWILLLRLLASIKESKSKSQSIISLSQDEHAVDDPCECRDSPLRAGCLVDARAAHSPVMHTQLGGR